MKAVEFEVSVKDTRELKEIINDNRLLRSRVEWTSTTSFEVDNDEDVLNEVFLVTDEFEVEKL